MADSDVHAVRELLRDAFTRQIEHVDDLTDGLTDEVSFFRPTAHANSIAWLIWHSARQQDMQLCHLAGVQQVWTRDGWDDRFGLDLGGNDHGYGHDPEDVAQGPGARGPARQLLPRRAQGHAGVHRVGDRGGIEPRGGHPLDTAGHCERSARQHHRRRRAASRAGRLHPRHRRLTWKVSPAAERCCCGRGSLSWPCSRSAWRSANARRRWTIGFITFGARPRASCCSSPTRGCWPSALLFGIAVGALPGQAAARGGDGGVPARRHRARPAAQADLRAAQRVGHSPIRAATPPRSSIVMGMLVLLAGAAWWAVVVAAVVSVARGGRAGRHLPLLHRHRRRVAAGQRGGVRRCRRGKT